MEKPSSLFIHSRMKIASPLYMHSGKVPLASKLSFHVRRRIFDLFLNVIQPGPNTAVLDLGVTSDDTYPESNYFETFYPYHEKVTCAGTEDGSHLENKFPGVRYVRVIAGEGLPFGDKEFDVVFSNAVVEHTGNKVEQSLFIHEICRVGQRFFITTPNRWFPVETHTGIPLLHFLPKAWFRTLVRGTRYDYWSHEKNLNLLTIGEFRDLFPSTVMLELEKVRILGIPSNLIAFGAAGE